MHIGINQYPIQSSSSPSDDYRRPFQFKKTDVEENDSQVN